MTYRILLTSSAYSDIEQIKKFIEIDNPVAAKNYIAKLFEKLESLKFYPKIGKRIYNSFFNYAQCMYLICLNHVVFYRINELCKCIYIVRVLSHYQDWKNIINKDLISTQKTIKKGENVSLALINESMIYDIWDNSLDDDNVKYVPDEVFNTLEETADVVDHIIKNYKNKQMPLIYAIMRNSDNANMGYVQLNKANDIWEIGYHVAKIYTKNGYATEAVNLFLDIVKETMNIDIIYGIVLYTNKASKRVLEKCGFKTIYEGEGKYQNKKRKIIKAIKQLKT